MPKSHRDYGKWPPERMLSWGRSLGPNVGKVVEAILGRYRNPEFGYRAVQALVRDAQRVGNQRLDAACARALSVGALSYRHVSSILQHGLDRAPALDIEPRGPSLTHENVRGRDYYH